MIRNSTALALVFCSLWNTGDIFAQGETSGGLQAYKELYRRPASIPYPEGNAYSEARADLGHRLFFDPRLSRSNWISCATCHNPGLAWGDGLPVGLGDGMKALPRKTPTILNLAWGELMHWDGRSSSLEEQAIGPINNTAEMNLSSEELIQKIKAVSSYKPLFEKAYPGEGISLSTIGKAIATFERQIVSQEAPFDLWIRGHDTAISAAAKRGFVLFNEKALCSKCHSGWRFTDDSFHDIGVADQDKGRGLVLPDIPVLQHAFKTPTLRNIEQRSPYLHNGSEKTLADVITFYNQGGKAQRANQSEHVRPLQLTSGEMQDLLAFLKSLTSQDKPIHIPVLPY